MLLLPFLLVSLILVLFSLCLIGSVMNNDVLPIIVFFAYIMYIITHIILDNFHTFWILQGLNRVPWKVIFDAIVQYIVAS